MTRLASRASTIRSRPFNFLSLSHRSSHYALVTTRCFPPTFGPQENYLLAVAPFLPICTPRLTILLATGAPPLTPLHPSSFRLSI